MCQFSYLLPACLEGMAYFLTDFVLLNNLNTCGIDQKEQNEDKHTKLNDDM